MTKQPNIVVIMTDQQRADLVAREGYPLDTMPTCDRLAREGQWFNRVYTTCPNCVPARVSFLTGRFGSATRIRCNHNNGVVAEKHLVELMREAGYRTALSGKNHSHLHADDFDAFFGYGHENSPARTDEEKAFDRYLQQYRMHLIPEPTPFPVDLQYPYRIVSDACDWIDESSDQPFFLWMSFAEPHNPYQVPHPYYDLFPPADLPPCRSDESALEGRPYAWRWCRKAFRRAFPDHDATIDRARSNYHGLLRLIDNQIQRFVEYLDTRGLRDDTLLVITSDHGDFVGEYGLIRKGPGLPELLTRIPLIVNGPGVKQMDEANSAHVSLADLLPTLCTVAGAPIPAGVQGRDLSRLLTGAEDPARYRSMIVEQGYGGAAYDGSEPLDPRDDGFTPSPDGQTWGAYDCLNSRTQSGTRRSIRAGDWKLVMASDGYSELYDLSRDPVELNNRWPDPACREIRSALQEQLLQWMLRLEDVLPLPAQRYVVKHETEVCP